MVAEVTERSGRKLAGVNVLVTRAANQAQELIECLESDGATVTHLPAIEIVPVEDSATMAALSEIDTFDWVCFTSANTVRVLFDHFEIDPERLSNSKVAAVGSVTARHLREAGVGVNFVPSVATGAVLGAELAQLGMSGVRVLIPGSQRSRRELDQLLADVGADITSVDCYTSVPAEAPSDLQLAIDIATFYSPSAVMSTLNTLGKPALDSASIVCIGPTTAQSAADHGLTVRATAKTADLNGMLEAVIRAAVKQQT